MLQRHDVDPTTAPALSPAPVAGKPRGRLTPHARAEAAERRQLENDLRAAVAQGSFVLHYQPRLLLGSGRIVAAEALIRWPHRKRGMISPAGFIPAAEQSGLINAIGGWVLLAACQEAQAWGMGDDPAAIGAAPCEIGVSVNVSPRQLRDECLLEQVAEALETTGLTPERLELELTESMLLDVDIDTLLTLSAIRDLGVGLALDDFGTGFASLAMLKRLPLTVMKLDRSLVRELPASREDAAIVRAVVETGHALGLTVVAEGVETEQQRAFLSGIGCDQGQGYLFSHPVPAPQMREQLAAADARPEARPKVLLPDMPRRDRRPGLAAAGAGLAASRREAV